jgi:hypothetical protein
MAMYDPRLYEEIRKKDINDLVNQLELYVQQEDFSHPGFYALLRQLMVPPDLIFSITKTAEKLRIPGCDPSFYSMLNRKIKERMYPLIALYHKGLVHEGDALWSGRERSKRTRVIRGKSWKDKVKGVMSRDSDDKDDESEQDT